MKNKKQAKKAVAYYRTATAKQSGNTIEAQKNQCREWAKQNGYKIVDEYEDKGVSGSKLNNRKALDQTLARCQDKTNPIDTLLVTDVDRLARNEVDHFFIKNQLSKSNTRLIAVNQPMINDIAEGQLFETILAGVNSFYKRTKRRNHEKCSNL